MKCPQCSKGHSDVTVVADMSLAKANDGKQYHRCNSCGGSIPLLEPFEMEVTPPPPAKDYTPKLLRNTQTQGTKDEKFSAQGRGGLYSMPDVLVSSREDEAKARADGFVVEILPPPPPTVKEIIARGYTRYEAEHIVKEEERKHFLGEPPYDTPKPVAPAQVSAPNPAQSATFTPGRPAIPAPPVAPVPQTP